MAEEVGFEPTVPFDITSFQDWLLKPLGHSSICYKYNYISFFKIVNTFYNCLIVKDEIQLFHILKKL